MRDATARKVQAAILSMNPEKLSSGVFSAFEAVSRVQQLHWQRGHYAPQAPAAACVPQRSPTPLTAMMSVLG
jgi:hypothetical protein